VLALDTCLSFGTCHKEIPEGKVTLPCSLMAFKGYQDKFLQV